MKTWTTSKNTRQHESLQSHQNPRGWHVWKRLKGTESTERGDCGNQAHETQILYVGRVHAASRSEGNSCLFRSPAGCYSIVLSRCEVAHQITDTIYVCMRVAVTEKTEPSECRQAKGGYSGK